MELKERRKHIRELLKTVPDGKSTFIDSLKKWYTKNRDLSDKQLESLREYCGIK